MNIRRTNIEIIKDILLAIRQAKGLKPTHVMYKANLSHKLLKDYLKELTDKKLITDIEEKGKKMIIITDTGLKFLEKYEQMEKFKESFGL